MICYSVPVQKRSSRSPAILDVWGRDRLLQCAAYLEPEAAASSPCSLCRPCRRALARPYSVDSIPPRFLLPRPVLRRVFRGKFVVGLKSAFQHQQLHFAGDLAPIAQPKIFASWLRPLFRKNWVVYCKPPFGGPESVLQYLGRYTHRVAISNHRLISLADGQVTFRWRDSAHHNEQKVMSLSLDEFLRRFLLHLLPKGFVHIRHFGFLANRRRATLLPLYRQALAVVQPQTTPEAVIMSLQNANALVRKQLKAEL